MYARPIPILLLLLSTGAVADSREDVRDGPIVIAHRGASGYRPEHTLAGYRLAIEQGADFIEPDLVLTRDGVLVARHDHYLSTTTDVADHPEFADRKRRLGDHEDWFSEDFTLEEIKTLRARQAFEGRSREHDGRYEIPTFSEVIDLALEKSAERGRPVGIYPETKVPGHFKSLGFDFASMLLEALKQTEGQIPVFIQSFEPGILEELRGRTDYPLVQLVNPTRGPLGGMQPGVPNIPLDEIAKFADAVGAMKALLVDREGKPTTFVADAHALGLDVHIWTIRDDAVPEMLFRNVEVELRYFLDQGIDGFFTDFPDTGVRVRDAYLADISARVEVGHDD